MKQKIILFLSIASLLSFSPQSRAGVAQNTAYLDNTGKEMCSQLFKEETCTQNVDQYFSRFQIPGSDDVALIAYESGFIANICLDKKTGYRYSTLAPSDVKVTESDSVAKNCMLAAINRSKFAEIRALASSDCGKKHSTFSWQDDHSCLSDLLMKIHEKYNNTQSESCETKLQEVKNQMVQLNSSVVTSQNKTGINQIIQSISAWKAQQAAVAK